MEKVIGKVRSSSSQLAVVGAIVVMVFATDNCIRHGQHGHGRA